MFKFISQFETGMWENKHVLVFVSYEWVEARDGQFGVEDEFGNWSGLVGELHDKVTNYVDLVAK